MKLKFRKKRKNNLKANVVAIIPARSGSKGIKNKNLSMVRGKSLLKRSIDICKKSKFIDYYFVFTDSKKYSSLAKQYGADVPFDRPKSISGDKSQDYDFVEYCLKKLISINCNPEFIINIRPTTPFRDYKKVDRAIKYFKINKNKFSSLRSVHELSETSFKDVVVRKKLLYPLLKGFDMDQINQPRQKFEKTYAANGYIDIYKSAYVLKNKKLFGKKVCAFITEPVIEIDNKFDLKIANNLYKNFKD